MTRLSLLGLYVVFAVIATIANLLTQRIVLFMNDGAAGFTVAVFMGTLIGLMIKYFLDKRWIFRDLTAGTAANGKKFALYSAMGIFTTAIFWITETAFWLQWRTDMMRELGAVIGLMIGYTVKYQLDRRFVFTNSAFVKPV
ncbi:putative flippase GtrA [Loktanella ponticola]|uniref:Putative flippase GtrA n=1 Tax=Yoonia ponticola TaxID=1524255 RepID=A0A7W9EYL3_9RHOB|nr:GtrA family protein [Yoonia ponticola]MBB5721255.1 putative flippase GtrA [Yoonia ponticola]